MSASRAIPFATTLLVMGILSIPLAFLRHLVSLAVVLSVLALVLRGIAWFLLRRKKGPFAGRNAARWGTRAALVGLACAVMMWWLYASGILLRA